MSSQGVPTAAISDRRPQIVEQLDEVYNEISRLTTLVSNLNERLSPVLSEDYPPAQPTCKIEESLVPLANQLRSIHSQIHNECNCIASILHRLEV